MLGGRRRGPLGSPLGFRTQKWEKWGETSDTQKTPKALSGGVEILLIKRVGVGMRFPELPAGAGQEGNLSVLLTGPGAPRITSKQGSLDGSIAIPCSNATACENIRTPTENFTIALPDYNFTPETFLSTLRSTRGLRTPAIRVGFHYRRNRATSPSSAKSKRAASWGTLPPALHAWSLARRPSRDFH